MAGRPKGLPKSGGREAGTQNKYSTTVKQSLLDEFMEAQKDKKGDLRWFRKNYPKEFYLIAAKLIPTEVTGAEGGDIVIKVVRT